MTVRLQNKSHFAAFFNQIDSSNSLSKGVVVSINIIINTG
jgi:hypothetical protein